MRTILPIALAAFGLALLPCLVATPADHSMLGASFVGHPTVPPSHSGWGVLGSPSQLLGGTVAKLPKPGPSQGLPATTIPSTSLPTGLPIGRPTGLPTGLTSPIAQPRLPSLGLPLPLASDDPASKVPANPDGPDAFAAASTSRQPQQVATGAGGFLAGFLALLLFSRIEGEHVLDNPVRQRVLQVISMAPGSCIADLRERAGIAWGTTVYHLHRLENAGLVVSVRHAGARRHFAANTPASRERAGIAALAHPTAQRIADLVHRTPGIDQTGVCRALGLQAPSASKHLGRLEALGLVTAQRVGRNRLYEATPVLQGALAALVAPAGPDDSARPCVAP